jgi:ubiquinone/menaquinone biosynthesis C-methylase UbiE
MMAQTDTVFAGSIPAFYDRYLGPLLFQPYAADLAARLTNIADGRVLETAAGTGIVTRELARTLPDTVEMVATDLNQPMIDFAAAQPGVGRVTWQQADALALPFEDRSFDAVVCQFGVMFFSDKLAAYREVLRVLKPRGRFVFNVWDRIEENEIGDIVTEALAALYPEDPPRFFARTPHSYHDLDTIRRELAEAGFSSVEVETLPRLSRAQSAREPAIGLCHGTPLRSEIEARDPGGLDVATDAAANAIAARFGSGPITARMKAHVITASA